MPRENEDLPSAAHRELFEELPTIRWADVSASDPRRERTSERKDRSLSNLVDQPCNQLQWHSAELLTDHLCLVSEMKNEQRTKQLKNDDSWRLWTEKR